jgi:hypothetical protein
MFRFRHSSVVSAFGVLAISLVASAGSLRVHSDDQNPAPALTFFVKGPIGFDINGKFSGMKIADDGTNVTFTAPLDTISTGIGKRDKHAKETFEVSNDKYKMVTVVVPKNALKHPADGKSEDGTVTAKVTLHGETKSVPVSYKATRAGDVYKIDGKFELKNVWDGFKMTKPCMAGVCVKDDVKVAAKFSVKDQ